MLDGKLRIAPTCYHVLHLIPVMSAHEMGFFYDEGLKSSDGLPAYTILRQAMVPFGLEKLGVCLKNNRWRSQFPSSQSWLHETGC